MNYDLFTDFWRQFHCPRAYVTIYLLHDNTQIIKVLAILPIVLGVNIIQVNISPEQSTSKGDALISSNIFGYMLNWIKGLCSTKQIKN